jgi:hypothetical protein
MKLFRIAHQVKSKLKLSVQPISKARIMKFINEAYFSIYDDEVREYLDSKKPKA